MAKLRSSLLEFLPCSLGVAVGVLLAIVVVTSLAYRQMNPGWVSAQRAFAAAVAGDRETAVAQLSIAQDRGRKIPGVQVRIAEAAAELGDLGLAEEAFARIAEVRPADRRLVTGYASVLHRLGRPSAALHVFLQGLEHDAKLDASAQLQLAGLYRQALLYPEAEEIYRELLRVRGSRRQAQLELGEMLAWQREFDASLALFEALAEQYPADREVMLAHARVLDWAGRPDEALQRYRTISEE